MRGSCQPWRTVRLTDSERKTLDDTLTSLDALGAVVRAQEAG